MKAYKGFNKDMTCRGFQYKEGETFTHDGDVELCEQGFHACEDPLDCLAHYIPADSEYHEVELEDVSDERDCDDTKVVAKKITIGAKIDIPHIVQLGIEYRRSKCTTTKEGMNKKNLGAASATGYRGAASATGDRGAASATGYRGAASATGDLGAASATGCHGAASATGYRGAASATGDRGAASATGYRGAASATGYRGAASATGMASVAVAAGLECTAKGAIGCALCLIERKWNDDTNIYEIVAVKAVIVDGKKIKPDTWYTLVDGKVKEVK